MPLSLIGEVIDKLKEIRYFLTNKGLFESKMIYFGLCNSLGTFQRMMNSIFRELLYEGVLANYMNDFVIPTKIKKELEEWTIWFLK